MPVFNVYGGGGGGLNINVQQYDSYPETAEENTIGVVHPLYTVTGYVCSPVEPTENLITGLLWIVTGTSSNTPIPADTYNNVIIYPVGAKIYLGGMFGWTEFADRVKCYQCGEWRLWRKYLYTAGTQNVDWSTYTSSLQTDCIYVGKTTTTSNSPRVYTTNTVDVTYYKKLYVEYRRDADDLSSDRFLHGIADTQDGSGAASYLVCESGSSKIRNVSCVDISSYTGGVYVKLSNNSPAQTSIKLTYVYNVWLEG